MKHLYLAIVSALIILLAGCGGSASTPAGPSPTASSSPAQVRLSVTDSAGASVEVNKNPQSVVVLSASLAELWLEAGGAIAGTTGDTFEAGRFDNTKQDNSYNLSTAKNVGTIKDPSSELILALSPELVILSPTISGHKAVATVLEEAGVPVYFADADSFSDYLEVFKDFTDLTGRHDLYKSLGDTQKKAIDKMIQSYPDGEKTTALVLRAFSSGVKAKADGIVLTNILQDLGVVNIASGDTALSENLSLETVVEKNPNFIFIVYMGSETDVTNGYLQDNLYSDPVWSALTAVQNSRVYILPQDLFHYKPNDRWEEAYAYLLKILLQK
jgi:iron complex transport system substrate-binding protein